MSSNVPNRCEEMLTLRALHGDERAVVHHLADCKMCSEDVRLLDEHRDALVTSAPSLDDLSRARMWAALAEDVDAACRVEPVVPRNRTAIRALAALAAALLLVVGLALLTQQRSDQTPEQRVAEKKTKSRDVAGRALVSRSRYASTDFISPRGRLARVLRRSPLAAALSPSAEVRVQRSSARELELKLVSGTLLGSYDGRRGGRLRIVAAGVRVEVIGTVFMVAAEEGEPAKVAVERGRVVVGVGRDAVAVSGGMAWSAGSGLHAMAKADQTLLRQFHGETRSALAARLANRPRSTSPRRGRKTVETTQPVNKQRPSSQFTEPPSAAKRDVVASKDSVATGSPGPEARTPPGNPAGASDAPAKTATGQYALAERAMKAGDLKKARHRLLVLVALWPRSPLVSQARYDLARLAYQSGRLNAVVSHIKGLRAGGCPPALREGSDLLLCRTLLLQRKRAEAAVCLTGFSQRYPNSRAGESVAASLTLLSGSCADAVKRGTRYLRRFPKGKNRASVQRLVQGCRKEGARIQPIGAE